MANATRDSVYCRSTQQNWTHVEYCHQHNLVDPRVAATDCRYGIRVTLPQQDPMQKVLGENWERLHWYPSERERDQAYQQMALHHGYYRDSDYPSQVLEKIAR